MTGISKNCLSRPGLLAPLASAASLAMLPSGPCHAAAAWLTESGGADMGMAGAGRAALALDAAALAANPAALAGLGSGEITAAYLPVRMTFEYQGGAGSPGSVSNDSTTPAGSLFATGNGGRWSYGAGIYSQAGAGVDYGREWAGRYVVEDAQLRTLNVSGALAYRITDRLDVGAALGAQYADVDAGVAVNNAAAIYGPPGDLPDGQVKMSGSSWQPVGSIVLRYRVNDDTRIGLSWTSAVHQAPTLDVRAARLHPVLSSLVPRASSADMEFTLPQQVSLGVARQLTPATLVAVGAGWQDWSAFGDSTLTLLDRRIAMFPHGLRDTWNVSAGVRHQLSPAWALSAGAAYDSSPGKEPTMPAYFPVGEQRRVAVGAEYRQASGAVVRAALSVIDQPDVRVAPPDATWPLPGTGSFGGTVQSNRAYVFCIATDFAM